MIPVRPCNILLPKNADFSKWAVVACDQFTSEKDYWLKLKNFIGDSRSTLNLIYPEAYLGEDGKSSENRISNIKSAMREYLSSGVFCEYKDSCVLIKRTLLSGVIRYGLVLAVDLEEYSFDYPTSSSVRSTEAVVKDRIPPRVKIREGAAIELPHIIMLMDDEKREVIETLAATPHEKVYDFELNMDGGHAEGYLISGSEFTPLIESYAKRKRKEGKFLFAVGDGNHSLATALTCWQKIKPTLSEEERKTHPARFALCELENVYDDGVIFYPIHRFVYGADEEFIRGFSKRLNGESSVTALLHGKEYKLSVPSYSALAIAEIQNFVEEYASTHTGVKVDYIHGDENLRSVERENKGVAIFMPSILKSELFDYVASHGLLAKKSFSMGEANEKRYYIEAKKITYPL